MCNISIIKNLCYYNDTEETDDDIFYELLNDKEYHINHINYIKYPLKNKMDNSYIRYSDECSDEYTDECSDECSDEYTDECSDECSDENEFLKKTLTNDIQIDFTIKSK